MSDIKLSICIPTYNRARHLEKALGYFADLYVLPFAYEIVISDNASTDQTRAVVDAFTARGLPIRYFRQVENCGAERNFSSAFRHARGEYIIYQADDDILVVDGLVEAIRYLDSNADVGACFAPWYLHNEVEGADTGLFYDVPVDIKFRKDEFDPLFGFLIEKHVFPEIGIYRAAALRGGWQPRYFAFSAFSNLAHYLAQGAVAFLREPFYRAVIQSKITRERAQAGHDEVLTAWDRYRGGLEYFLTFGARRGAVRLTPERRAIYDSQIRQFTAVRMTVAMRHWAERRDYIKAYEICSRLVYAGFAEQPLVAQFRQSLPMLAKVQSLAILVNSAAEVDRLLLQGVSNPAALQKLLADLGLRPEIAIVADMSAIGPQDAGRTAVFVPKEQDRETFIAKGYFPNLVLCEADIADAIAM